VSATDSIVIQGKKVGASNPSSINSAALILAPNQRQILMIPEV
jgi:hypothetical protein